MMATENMTDALRRPQDGYETDESDIPPEDLLTGGNAHTATGTQNRHEDVDLDILASAPAWDLSKLLRTASKEQNGPLSQEDLENLRRQCVSAPAVMTELSLENLKEQLASADFGRLYHRATKTQSDEIVAPRQDSEKSKPASSSDEEKQVLAMMKDAVAAAENEQRPAGAASQQGVRTDKTEATGPKDNAPLRLAHPPQPQQQRKPVQKQRQPTAQLRPAQPRPAQLQQQPFVPQGMQGYGQPTVPGMEHLGTGVPSWVAGNSGMHMQQPGMPMGGMGAMGAMGGMPMHPQMMHPQMMQPGYQQYGSPAVPVQMDAYSMRMQHQQQPPPSQQQQQFQMGNIPSYMQMQQRAPAPAVNPKGPKQPRKPKMEATKVRPCEHNQWERISKKKHSISLRCRVCKTCWKTKLEFFSKCADFYAGNCTMGDRCEHPHIYSKAAEKHQMLKKQAEGEGESSGEGEEEEN